MTQYMCNMKMASTNCLTKKYRVPFFTNVLRDKIVAKYINRPQICDSLTLMQFLRYYNLNFLVISHDYLFWWHFLTPPFVKYIYIYIYINICIYVYIHIYITIFINFNFNHLILTCFLLPCFHILHCFARSYI